MRRGVIFIREFVPRKIIPLFANSLYNENYITLPMSSGLETLPGKINCFHEIQLNKKKYSLRVSADDKPFLPPEDSAEHFFKEHEWGFGKSKSGGKLVYRVEHPFWEIYPLEKYEMDFDFGGIYGRNWQFLNSREPYNVVFCKGSDIKLFSAEK
jgi:hypothetical protein